MSRALISPERVKARTRERILKIISELRYAPNASASSLRQARTRRILAVVPTIGSSYFASMLEAVEQAATEEGYTILVGSTEGSAKAVPKYAEMLPRRIVDGMISISSLHPSLHEWIRGSVSVYPLVTALSFDSSLPVSSVGIDEYGCSFDAMGHLYNLGHRRVAVIAGPLSASMMPERLRGVHAQAKAQGLLDTLRVEHGIFGFSHGFEAAARLLSTPDRPTAIYCMSDTLAIGASDCARRLGFNLPADLSVVGFGDIDVARYLTPSLTTIAVPLREIGREAVRMLVDILEKRHESPRIKTLPHRLTIRDSAKPPPAIIKVV